MPSWIHLLAVVLLLCISVDSASLSSEDDDTEKGRSLFTDQWAVHISGGDQVADAIAAKHGFTNLGKVRRLLYARTGRHTFEADSRVTLLVFKRIL